MQPSWVPPTPHPAGNSTSFLPTSSRASDQISLASESWGVCARLSDGWHEAAPPGSPAKGLKVTSLIHLGPWAGKKSQEEVSEHYLMLPPHPREERSSNWLWTVLLREEKNARDLGLILVCSQARKQIFRFPPPPSVYLQIYKLRGRIGRRAPPPVSRSPFLPSFPLLGKSEETHII